MKIELVQLHEESRRVVKIIETYDTQGDPDAAWRMNDRRRSEIRWAMFRYRGTPGRYFYSVKACPTCGLIMPDYHARVRYCSADCRKRSPSPAKQEPYHKKKCWHCGEDFTSSRSDAKFCSAKCRVYANRAAKAK